jgi:hypothetical protein
MDGVEITIENMVTPIMFDQSGKTERDNKISGHKVEIKMKLGEVQKKSNWLVAFPNANIFGTDPNQLVTYGNSLGFGFYANAKVLKLHPMSKISGDVKYDWTFKKAVAKGTTTFTFGPEEQQGLEVVFSSYLDDDELFFLFGDESLIAGTKATKTIQGLIFTAVNPGVGGNAIEIIYVADGTAGSESVDVTGSVITVHAGLVGAKSTSNQVKASIQDSLSAMALVTILGGNNVADQVADDQFLIGGA